LNPVNSETDFIEKLLVDVVSVCLDFVYQEFLGVED